MPVQLEEVPLEQGVFKQRKTHPSSSISRDAPEPPMANRPETNDRAGCTQDAIAIATAFESLKNSLETILTRLSRTNEHSERVSRRVLKKPRCY